MSEHAIQTSRVTAAFADAERVAIQRNDGSNVNLVVLAVMSLDGADFALVTPEGDLGTADGLCVYGYATDGEGSPSLSVIEDDEIYADAFHCFGDLFIEDEEEPSASA